MSAFRLLKHADISKRNLATGILSLVSAILNNFTTKTDTQLFDHDSFYNQDGECLQEQHQKIRDSLSSIQKIQEINKNIDCTYGLTNREFSLPLLFEKPETIKELKFSLSQEEKDEIIACSFEYFNSLIFDY